LKLQEWDEGNGLHKFNPLVDWTWDDVWAYVKQYKLPYNALMTVAIPASDAHRAPVPSNPDRNSGRPLVVGRHRRKECGLHVGPHKGDAKS
jgi:3''-phosphoadenosine 5''-phosphosulfate sulfotransferase (PAPS reductase)/FAD synthetase and related enzymes